MNLSLYLIRKLMNFIIFMLVNCLWGFAAGKKVQTSLESPQDKTTHAAKTQMEEVRDNQHDPPGICLCLIGHSV